MGLFTKEPPELFIELEEAPVTATGLSLLINSFTDEAGLIAAADLYSLAARLPVPTAAGFFRAMAGAGYLDLALNLLDRVDHMVRTGGAGGPLAVTDEQELKALFVAIRLVVEGLNQERDYNSGSGPRMMVAAKLGRRIRIKLRKLYRFDTDTMNYLS